MAHVDTKTSTTIGGKKWRAPDGGWGWVVVFSSFIIHVIMDGITYSMGTYLSQWSKEFNVSHGSVSIIHALLPAVTLSCGPIASMFTNKFGCRLTTIIGSLIASVGFVLSYFATSIYYLYITIGLIVGFGFGLIYVPAIVSVGYYFEKRRSFAIGIAVCGTGLGTFILSPTNRKLTGEFGWKGALLIKGAFVLNGIVCGLVMRPLPIEPAEVLKNEKKQKKALAKKRKIEMEKNIASSDNSKQFLSPDRIPPMLYLSEPHNLGKQYMLSEDIGKSLQFIDKEGDCNEPSIRHIRNSFKQNSSINMLAQCRSLKNIPAESDGSDNSIPQSFERAPDSLCHKLNKIIDFRLFQDFIFVFFAVSNFLTSLGFNVPFIFIIDQATQISNIDPSHADWLLSTIGISNTVGRVILGLLADMKCMNRLYLYATVLTISGIATMVEPICTTFTGYFLYAIVFGFTSGGYVSITSILLVDLLGLKKLTNAFGILLVFQGVATAIGPPIAGFLYDFFKSYTAAYLFTGFMITISGLLIFIIPCFSCYKTPEEVENLETDNEDHQVTTD